MLAVRDLRLHNKRLHQQVKQTLDCFDWEALVLHIIIGFLGSVITILWLLHRLAEMGIDLGGLNPWLWQRRRKWRNLHVENPIFRIDSPMEATALLVTALAKADGEMSSVEKKEVLSIFESEFSLSKRDAAGLLISSNYLLAKGDEVRSNLRAVLKPSLEEFKPEQLSSALELIERIAEVDGPTTDMQHDILDEAAAILNEKLGSKGKWD